MASIGSAPAFFNAFSPNRVRPSWTPSLCLENSDPSRCCAVFSDLAVSLHIRHVMGIFRILNEGKCKGFCILLSGPQFLEYPLSRGFIRAIIRAGSQKNA